MALVRLPTITHHETRFELRIGLLTGGGDCPGLNAAIRAVVKQGMGEYGHTIIGFRNGWKGVVDGDIIPLGRQDIRNVLPVGERSWGPLASTPTPPTVGSTRSSRRSRPNVSTP